MELLQAILIFVVETVIISVVVYFVARLFYPYTFNQIFSTLFISALLVGVLTVLIPDFSPFSGLLYITLVVLGLMR